MPTNPQEAAAKAAVLTSGYPTLSRNDRAVMNDAIATALTEARSAALREAAERIATLEPVCTGGSYSYAAGFRSGLDAAEIELGRMAGGAEGA